MVRVIKPGGTLIVDWPFLVPVHEYPQHYFNATEQGGRETFAKLGVEVESYIPPWFHPIFSLRWILDEWRKGLPSAEQQSFLDLTVAEILSKDSASHLDAPWVTGLPSDKQGMISAGTRFRVIKRGH